MKLKEFTCPPDLDFEDDVNIAIQELNDNLPRVIYGRPKGNWQYHFSYINPGWNAYIVYENLDDIVLDTMGHGKNLAEAIYKALEKLEIPNDNLD